MHLRRRRHTIALAAVLLAVTLGSTACGSSDGAGYSADGTSAAGGTSNGDAVSIAGFAFDPSSSSVSVGATVTWTNTDGATHTVTADDGSFDSGKLGNGETFTHSFDAVGTFSYHCEIHSSMTGSIVVSA